MAVLEPLRFKMTKDEQSKIAEVATDVKWLVSSLKELQQENAIHHTKINDHLNRLNGKTQRVNEAVFGASENDEGCLMVRVNRNEAFINWMKSKWYLLVGFVIILVVLGDLAGTYLKMLI